MLKKIKREHVFVFIYILFLILYFFYRAAELKRALMAYTYLFFAVFFILKLKKFNIMRLIKGICLFGTFIYLVYSYFNFRGDSWDGLNLYLRNVLLLADKPYVSYLEFPPMPYLAELVLAAIFKFGSLRLMNLFFGIGGLGSVITTYFLYRRLNLSSYVTNWSLYILFTSPLFLAIALYHFKVDLFLLCLANIVYIFFIKSSKHNSITNTFLFGFFICCAILVKVSFISFGMILIFLWLINLFLDRVTVIKFFECVSLLLVSFVLPLFVWIYYLGIFIPPNIYIHAISPKIDSPKISLTRDSAIVSQCARETKIKDYGQFFNISTPFHKLLQPYYFVTNQIFNKDTEAFVFSLYNPGPILYFGIFVFLLLPLSAPQVLKIRFFIPFYVLTVAGFALYMFFTSTVYWYILTLFPFIAMSVPLVIERLSSKKLRRVVEISILFVGFLHILVGIIRGGLALDFTQAMDSKKHNENVKNIYAMNKDLEVHTQNGFIFDVSEPYYLFFPFFKNSDKKFLKSDYFFVSSKKSLDQMRAELLQNNIRYIAMHKSNLIDIYPQECLIQNDRLLNEFLSKYATLKYTARDTVFLYEIQ